MLGGLEVVLAELGFVFLNNILEFLLLLGHIVVVLNNAFHIMVICIFDAEDVVVGQVLRVPQVLVARFNLHLVFQIGLRLVHLLALLHELALILVLRQSAVPVPRVHIAVQLHFLFIVSHMLLLLLLQRKLVD